MQIFIYRNQKEVGPYTKAMALEALELGAFSSQDFARTAEMSEYKTLGEILNGLPTNGSAAQAASPVAVKAAPKAKVIPRPIGGAMPRPKVMPRPLPGPVKKGSPILSGAVAVAVLAAGVYVGFTPGGAGVRDYLASLLGTKHQEVVTSATPAPVVPKVVEEPKVPEPAAPEPEVEPEVPQLPGFNPAVLADNPALWPKSLRLVEAAPFPAVLNGRQVGTLKAPAGSSVKLVKISGENLTLDYQGGQAVLDWRKTNLEEAVAEIARLAAAEPVAVAPPAPAPTPSAPKKPVASASRATTGPHYGMTTVEMTSLPEWSVLERALRLADYKLTTDVERAYLRVSKAKALREITDSKELLPADFLSWIDSDPAVCATVYGARKNAAGILCVLRSLELDLGVDTVRREYTQLALAMAVIEAPVGFSADLSPRKPLQLTIPGDPRQPVNTHPKDRPLDENDHIINFLEDHPPVECDPFRVPEFKANSRGVAIVAEGKPARKGAADKADKKVKRGLLAADVIENKALQDEFNAYMAAHGQQVHIDCGDHAVAPHKNDMVTGPEGAGIQQAYNLFRGAYEAKGRLPQSRDPFPTAAERCAFIIRNDSHFPASKESQRNWDRFPVKSAPWPTMTLLVQSTDPLREREEVWSRFVDRGEAITYGEYTGGIAQQADFQAARRLSPYPFSYGTFQMMLKDGGVCGTMANMSVRTHIALGGPSCTAGQPGHCALIVFSKDKKTHDFICHGEQYVTGGDEKTYPHAKWYFGDLDTSREMVWHQSVAYGVNAGFQTYLDSMVALNLYKNLPEAKQKEKGLAMLQAGLAANRYNIAIVNEAAANPDFKNGLGDLSTFLTKSLNDHGNTPSCPSKGLYMDTVQKLLNTSKSEAKD